jgi:methyl-accepting chemotaxis protein-1 (serine sensor receptor)
MSTANDSMRELFTNQMPSAVDVAVADTYAARERLALDRAALLVGTPDSATAVERSREMRAQSDAWWKKYLDLPRGRRKTASRRTSPQSDRRCSATATRSARSSRPATVTARRRRQQLQVKYNDLTTASEALPVLRRSARLRSRGIGVRNVARRSVVALLAGFVAAVLSWLTLTRAIGRPLAEALGHFDAIAAGDLRRAIAAAA